MQRGSGSQAPASWSRWTSSSPPSLCPLALYRCRLDETVILINRATLGFKSMKTAYATIKGFEVMRMIRKRQCILLEPGVTGEVRFVSKLFGLAA